MPPLDLEFLKDRYDFELERKDKLTDALNLPVGILGGLGSLLTLMARSFSYQDPVLDYVERTEGTADEADLPSYVRMRIIEAADRNTANNDERSSLLYWARVWLFAVLTLTAFAGIPYVADQVRYSNAKAGKSTTNSAADTTEHDAAAHAVSAES